MNSDANHTLDNDEAKDRQLAREYILGKLTGEASLEFDKRFLESDRFSDTASEVESDILDAYAANQLNPDERYAVRNWAAKNSRNDLRLRIAETLHQTMQPRKVAVTNEQPNQLKWWHAWTISPFHVGLGAVAACLLLVFGAFIFIHMQHSQLAARSTALQNQGGLSPASAKPISHPLQPTTIASVESPKLPPSVQRAPLGIFTAMIMADESRDSSEPQVIAIPSTAQTLQLQLNSQAGISSGAYSVLLTTDKLQPVWQKSDLSLAKKSFLTVLIPAKPLEDGAYLLTLQPSTHSTEEKPLTYRFMIKHQ